MNMEISKQAIDAIERYLENKKLRTMVTYFGARRDLRVDLLKLMNGARPYPFPEHASWVVSHTGKKRDYWQPYLIDLVEIFLLTENHTILRNVAKAIKKLGVPEDLETAVIDRCLEIISKSENKVAAQVYAMHILIPFSKRYPELKDEIVQVIEMHSKGKTAAYLIAMRDLQLGKRKR